MSNKLNLIIDSNSFSNLSSIEINRKKTSSWLWQYFNVKTCSSVKDEFLKNVNTRSAEHRNIARKLINDKKLLLKTRYYSRLEAQWLKVNYFQGGMSSKNKGERHIICSALEYIAKKHFEFTIVVTDDNKARKGFINEIEENIFFGKVWTTIDLILYLYFRQPEVSFELTRNIIRDITSTDSISWKHYYTRGETEAQARLRMLKHYIGRLENIKNVKTILS